MRTLCDRLWNLQAKFTLREPHSWDPRQRTTWSRVVTSDFNSVLRAVQCVHCEISCRHKMRKQSIHTCTKSCTCTYCTNAQNYWVMIIVKKVQNYCVKKYIHTCCTQSAPWHGLVVTKTARPCHGTQLSVHSVGIGLGPGLGRSSDKFENSFRTSENCQNGGQNILRNNSWNL